MDGGVSQRTVTEATAARKAAALVVLWIPVLILGAYVVVMAERLPAVVATHWGQGVDPNGFMTGRGNVVSSVIPAVVGALMGTVGVLRTPRGTLVPTAALLLAGGALACVPSVVLVLTTQATLAAGDPTHADLGGWMPLVFAAMLWGLLPLRLLHLRISAGH